MKEKVLFVSLSAIVGGAEVYLERLAGLLAGDAELHAICANKDVAVQLRGRGVHVICIPVLLGAAMHRYLKYLLGAFAVIYMKWRYGIKLVHLNGYQVAYLAIVVQLIGSRAIIVPHHLPEDYIARQWYRVNARFCNIAVNVSATVDQEHRGILPRVNSYVIPNWITLNDNNLSLPKDRAVAMQRVLYVGRLAANKGVEDVIEAIRLLDGGISLIVAGDGVMRGQLERRARGLPVEFVGYYPNLGDLYHQCMALVVPSHGPEGSSLVALEAMASHVPCILSDLPVHTEIAQDGNTAVVFPVGSVADLAAAIKLLTSDPAGYISLAVRARTMIESVYSATAARAAYRSVLAQFIGGFETHI